MFSSQVIINAQLVFDGPKCLQWLGQRGLTVRKSFNDELLEICVYWISSSSSKCLPIVTEGRVLGKWPPGYGVHHFPVQRSHLHQQWVAEECSCGLINIVSAFEPLCSEVVPRVRSSRRRNPNPSWGCSVLASVCRWVSQSRRGCE